jgi:hypothetical protein
MAWYDMVSPRCAALKQSLVNSPMTVDVLVTSDDKTNGVAEVIARMWSADTLERRGRYLPDTTISIASSEGRVEFPLTFVSAGMRGWKLDGKQTLEALLKKSIATTPAAIGQATNGP